MYLGAQLNIASRQSEYGAAFSKKKIRPTRKYYRRYYYHYHYCCYDYHDVIDDRAVANVKTVVDSDYAYYNIFDYYNSVCLLAYMLYSVTCLTITGYRILIAHF